MGKVDCFVVGQVGEVEEVKEVAVIEVLLFFLL